MVSKRFYHNLACTIPGRLMRLANFTAILHYRAGRTIEYKDTVHVEVPILGYFVE